MEKDRGETKTPIEGEETWAQPAILRAFLSTATWKTCTLKALWLCFLLLWNGLTVLIVSPSRNDQFSHLSCHSHFDSSPLTSLMYIYAYCIRFRSQHMFMQHQMFGKSVISSHLKKANLTAGNDQ